MNLTVIARAESRALNSYLWYVNDSAPAVQPFLFLDTTVSGTVVGLSKMPYLRYGHPCFDSQGQ